MSYTSEYFTVPFEPVANAVVMAEGVRFTVITSRMIRIEYSISNSFEDRASQVIWYRKQEVPVFEVVKDEKTVEIITEHLCLRYNIQKYGFTRETLSIELKESGVIWHYGDLDSDNLFGTLRTLDKANGMMPLEKGLMSRAGWSLIDDTGSSVFDEEYNLVNRSTAEELEKYKDLYFLGYGHCYQECLQDYYRVSGTVPLLPKWMLGNWWSKYWEYTQEELTELICEFEKRGIPLSVCIIDMEWHIVKNLPYSGWTGYTWNRELFPDPEGFLKMLHEKGLKTSLNLHPADGVRPHEGMYEEVARFMGINPASKQDVEFDLTNPKFIEAYFKLLHHPLEKMGIDFWWIDWQQGTKTRTAGLDPLWILNHMHFCDLGRDQNKRPVIFSRWGGLGNHRYPIGFSGDTIVSWESLAFQPYFTQTASNVGYSWWSHDIGGHMGGLEDRELYTRWVQFGVFSPIMRLHSNKNRFNERLPWGYDEEIYKITKEAMCLRHALIPYIYTMSWRNNKKGIPLITPMYYLYPEQELAYQCTKQYFFGSELIASPYVSHTSEHTGMSRQVVWLPEGDWFNFFTGEHYEGNKKYALYGTLDEIPLFAKAGAIIPLESKAGWGEINNPEKLEICVFPGSNHSFDLYEDDGVSQSYAEGKLCTTTFRQEWLGNKLNFVIEPSTGDSSVIPLVREYILKFKGIKNPDEVKIHINGDLQSTNSNYCIDKEELIVASIRLSPEDKLEVSLMTHLDTLFGKKDFTEVKFEKALRFFKIPTYVKRRIFNDYHKIMENVSLLGRGFLENKRGNIPTFEDELGPEEMMALIEIVKKQELTSILA